MAAEVMAAEATLAEVTLAEVVPEGSTEADCQPQGVPAVKRFSARKLQVGRAWSAITKGPTEAGCQPQMVPAVKRFNGSRKLRVERAWPVITVVRSFHRLAGVSLLFAIPRQIGTEVRQIQLQTCTETQLRKQRSRPGIVHRNSVRQLTIEGTIGTGGETKMIAASNSSGPTASSNGAGSIIFGAVGMWPKHTIAAIGEIIAIEWQGSGTAAGWRYGTMHATTMMISSLTVGGQVAAGGREPSSASGIPGGGGELAVGTR